MVYIYLFPLYIYTIFHILFIHSPISRHLACFHLLAIMNNTAVTLIAKDLVNICFHFFWEFYPEVENWGLPWWLTGKESACNAGNPSSVLGLGRSPGEGNGSPFWYSCLGNPMDRGACWATGHRVARVTHDLAAKPPPPPGNWIVL